MIAKERAEPGLERERCRGSTVSLSPDGSCGNSSGNSSVGVTPKGLLSLSVSWQQAEIFTEIIEPGRDNERCLGSSPTVSSVSSGTVMRLGLSSSISSNCLDPRRGGGDNDVIPTFSSDGSEKTFGFRDRDGRLGVCICRKLGSFWNKVIFPPIGEAGGFVKMGETTSIVGSWDALGMFCE